MVKPLEKISIRIEEEILEKIDSLINHINIRSRSDAIRFLVKKGMKLEKIAVILSKGTDIIKKTSNIPKQNLKEQMKDNLKDYNLLTKIGNKTLIEHQIDVLKKYGYEKIYLITIPIVIQKIKKIIQDENIIFVENKEDLRTMDALRLLKGKIESDFLVIYGHNYPNMDLNSIFNQHIQNKHFATLNITWGGKDAVNSIRVNGTKIIKFEEKNPKTQSHLTYNSIFVVSPKMLNEKGHSLVYDVFPSLARRKLLDCFITPKRVLRLLKDDDKKEILKQIKLF